MIHSHSRVFVCMCDVTVFGLLRQGTVHKEEGQYGCCMVGE